MWTRHQRGGDVVQHDFCHKQLTLDRPARGPASTLGGNATRTLKRATHVLGIYLVSLCSQPGHSQVRSPPQYHSTLRLREAAGPRAPSPARCSLAEVFLIPQLVRADALVRAQLRRLARTRRAPPSDFRAVQQLLRGAPPAVPRGSAAVTQEATREPRGPAPRLQDLFHTRNERILRAAPEASPRTRSKA